MKTTHATFLADQWAAATDEAQNNLTAAALRQGITTADLARVGASPVTRAIWTKLVDRIRAGQVEPCEHLDPSAPDRLFWAQGLAPRRLQCKLCWIALHATLDVASLPDVGPCGSCDTPTNQAHAFNIVVGPVGIATVVCPSCYAITTATP